MVSCSSLLLEACPLQVCKCIMAAADYYKTPVTMRTYEEKLEIQAQDIDQKTLLFQAQLRGFLLRHRVSHRCKDDVAIGDINNILYENAKNAQYGDEYPKRDNVYVFDIGQRLAEAESAYLQARYQEPSNSEANDGKWWTGQV